MSHTNITSAEIEIKVGEERFKNAINRLVNNLEHKVEVMRLPKKIADSFYSDVNSRVAGGIEQVRSVVDTSRGYLNANPGLTGVLAFGGAFLTGYFSYSILRKKPKSQAAVNEFIDKCTERWLFEKTGVQLYDMALSKCPIELASKFREIRNQEKAHEEMLEDVIRGYGADPHILTPSARITQLESSGIVGVVRDEDYRAAVHALLAAELVDNASWDVLQKLACKLGDRVAKTKFAGAVAEEAEHLRFIRKQVLDTTLLLRAA